MSQYEMLRSKGHHGQLPHLNLAYMKQLEIPLPAPAEQCRISEALMSVQSKLRSEEMRRAALDALFQTLLHNLMTGRVRVKPSGLPCGKP
jgi:type I restriction enzyme S subunit